MKHAIYNSLIVCLTSQQPFGWNPHTRLAMKNLVIENIQVAKAAIKALVVYRSYVVIGLFSFASCFGCRQTSSEENSLKHIEGEVFERQNSFYWSDFQFEQIKDVLSSEVARGDLFTKDPIVQSRLDLVNLYFDKLVSEISARASRDGIHIPSPKIAFYKTKEVGGFVSTANVCYVLNGLLISSDEGGELDESFPLDNIGLLIERRSTTRDVYLDECDKKVLIDRSLLLDIFQQITADSFWPKDCDLAYDEKIQFVCPDFALDFDFIAIKTIPNRILLGSEILKDEYSVFDAMVILSHELAHYYLGHTSQFTWYPYRETKLGRDKGLPLEFKEGYELLEFLEASQGLSDKNPIPNASLNHEFYFAVKEIYSSLHRRGMCSEDELFDLLKSELTVSDIVSNGKVNDFVQFELNLLECANNIQVLAIDDGLWTELKAIVAQSTGDFGGYINTDSLMDIKRVHEPMEINDDGDHLSGDCSAKGAKPIKNSFPTLKDILFYLNDTINEKKSEMKQKRDYVNELQMAFYTNEQHADEVSLEYLSYVYPEYSKAPDFYLGLISNEDEKISCQQDFESLERDHNHFRPISDWLRPHHSLCFRAINLQREINFHGY